MAGSDGSDGPDLTNGGGPFREGRAGRVGPIWVLSVAAWLLVGRDCRTCLVRADADFVGYWACYGFRGPIGGLFGRR